MLLRSYNFNPDIDMGKVWSLFRNYEKLTCDCTCSCEIVEAALKGTIPLNKLDVDGNVIFDLQGYIYKFDKNRRLEKSRQYKKIKYLVDDMDDANGTGVVIDTLYLPTEDEYEKIINDKELERVLKYLDEMSLHFMVQDKVNIKVALMQAKKGIPEAVRLIKRIVERYPFMDYVLHVILQCGKSLEELFEQG